MAEKKWIASATEDAHGQFAAKAKAAGMSTREYAEKHKGDKGKTGKQARLALTLMGMHHGKKEGKKHRSAKEIRGKMYGSKE